MAIFVLIDDLSFMNAHEIREQLLDILEYEKEELLIDLKDVRIIDSTGLGLLIAIFKKARAKGVRFKLAHVQENVRQIFKMTLLDTVFDID